MYLHSQGEKSEFWGLNSGGGVSCKCTSYGVRRRGVHDTEIPMDPMEIPWDPLEEGSTGSTVSSNYRLRRS